MARARDPTSLRWLTPSPPSPSHSSRNNGDPPIRNPSAACIIAPAPCHPPTVSLPLRTPLASFFFYSLFQSCFYLVYPSFSLGVCEKGSQGWGHDGE